MPECNFPKGSFTTQTLFWELQYNYSVSAAQAGLYVHARSSHEQKLWSDISVKQYQISPKGSYRGVYTEIHWRINIF